MKFCCHEKVVTLAATTNLLNSVNWPSLEIKLICHEISFNLYNLLSSHERHTSCDIKVFYQLVSVFKWEFE